MAPATNATTGTTDAAQSAPAASDAQGSASKPADLSKLDVSAFADLSGAPLLKAVLLGDANLTDLDGYSAGASETLGEYVQAFNKAAGYDQIGASITFSKFSLVDLDQNGSPEVVLWVYGDTGFLVLHERDGAVYGNLLFWRQFSNVKEDGTFSFDGEWSYNGYATISFSNKNGQDGYTVTVTTHRVSNDEPDNGLVNYSYYVGQQSVTPEEWAAADEQESKKPDAVWFDFTEQNVEAVFSALGL